MVKVQVTILCENLIGRIVGSGEHGFSAFIETDKGKYLFDTGRGFSIITNSLILNKDLRTISKILIVMDIMTTLSDNQKIREKFPSRFLALRLLENDPIFINEVRNSFKYIRVFQERLEQAHGVPSDQVISSERHALAMNIFERVTNIIHSPKRDIRTTIDHVVMHKFVGYVILALIFLVFSISFSLLEVI